MPPPLPSQPENWPLIDYKHVPPPSVDSVDSFFRKPKPLRTPGSPQRHTLPQPAWQPAFLPCVPLPQHLHSSISVDEVDAYGDSSWLCSDKSPASVPRHTIEADDEGEVGMATSSSPGANYYSDLQAVCPCLRAEQVDGSQATPRTPGNLHPKNTNTNTNININIRISPPTPTHSTDTNTNMNTNTKTNTNKHQHQHQH